MAPGPGARAPKGRHKAAREPPHARRVDSHATCGVVAPSCVPSSRVSERARRQQRRWTEAGRGPSPPGVTPKHASRRLFERASWFTFLRQTLLEKSAAFSVGKAHPSAQDCYPVRSTHTHTHTHMNTCEHMCTRACEHTRICTCAHMLTRKHTMYAHTHPCTHSRTHTAGLGVFPGLRERPAPTLTPRACGRPFRLPPSVRVLSVSPVESAYSELRFFPIFPDKLCLIIGMFNPVLRRRDVAAVGSVTRCVRCVRIHVCGFFFSVVLLFYVDRFL